MNGHCRCSRLSELTRLCISKRITPDLTETDLLFVLHFIFRRKRFCSCDVTASSEVQRFLLHAVGQAMRCYTSLLHHIETGDQESVDSPVQFDELNNVLLYESWRFFDEHLDVHRVFRMSYLQERSDFPISDDVRLLCHIDMNQNGNPLFYFHAIHEFLKVDGFRTLIRLFRSDAQISMRICVSQARLMAAALSRIRFQNAMGADIKAAHEAIMTKVLALSEHLDRDTESRNQLVASHAGDEATGLMHCWEMVRHFTLREDGLDANILQLVERCFNLGHLVARTSACMLLEKIIEQYMAIYEYKLQDGVQTRLNVLISEWLLQQKMVDRLFGPNCHHQVLRNANFMLEHLAKTIFLTTDHLDMMWSAALAQSYCFRQVMVMLKNIVPHLSLQLVKHLNSLISSLAINLHTHETLQLAAELQTRRLTIGRRLRTIMLRRKLAPPAAESAEVFEPEGMEVAARRVSFEDNSLPSNRSPDIGPAADSPCPAPPGGSMRRKRNSDGSTTSTGANFGDSDNHSDDGIPSKQQRLESDIEPPMTWSGLPSEFQQAVMASVEEPAFSEPAFPDEPAALKWKPAESSSSSASENVIPPADNSESSEVTQRPSGVIAESDSKTESEPLSEFHDVIPMTQSDNSPAKADPSEMAQQMLPRVAAKYDCLESAPSLKKSDDIVPMTSPTKTSQSEVVNQVSDVVTESDKKPESELLLKEGDDVNPTILPFENPTSTDSQVIERTQSSVATNVDKLAILPPFKTSAPASAFTINAVKHMLKNLGVGYHNPESASSPKKIVSPLTSPSKAGPSEVMKQMLSKVAAEFDNKPESEPSPKKAAHSSSVEESNDDSSTVNTFDFVKQMLSRISSAKKPISGSPLKNVADVSLGKVTDDGPAKDEKPMPLGEKKPKNPMPKEEEETNLHACVNLFVTRLLLNVCPVDTRREWISGTKTINPDRLESISNALQAIENFDKTVDDTNDDLEDSEELDDSALATLEQSTVERIPKIHESQVTSEREARILEICNELGMSRIDAEFFLHNQEEHDRRKAQELIINTANENIREREPPIEAHVIIDRVYEQQLDKGPTKKAVAEVVAADSGPSTSQTTGRNDKETMELFLPQITDLIATSSAFDMLRGEMEAQQKISALAGGEVLSSEQLMFGIRVLSARRSCLQNAFHGFVRCRRPLSLPADSIFQPPDLPKGFMDLVGRVMLSRTAEEQGHLFKGTLCPVPINSLLGPSPKLTAAFKALFGAAITEVCAMANRSTVEVLKRIFSMERLPLHLLAPSSDESEEAAQSRRRIVPDMELSMVTGVLLSISHFWIREFSGLIHFRTNGARSQNLLGILIDMVAGSRARSHNFMDLLHDMSVKNCGVTREGLNPGLEAPVSSPFSPKMDGYPCPPNSYTMNEEEEEEDEEDEDEDEEEIDEEEEEEDDELTEQARREAEEADADKYFIRDVLGVVSSQASSESQQLTQLMTEANQTAAPGHSPLFDLVVNFGVGDSIDHGPLVPRRNGFCLEEELRAMFLSSLVFLDAHALQQYASACLNNVVRQNGRETASWRVLTLLLKQEERSNRGARAFHFALWLLRERKVMDIFFQDLTFITPKLVDHIDALHEAGTLNKNRPIVNFTGYNSENENANFTDTVRDQSEASEVRAISEAVTTRQEFLSVIFSCHITPVEFTLTGPQLDALWDNMMISLCPSFINLGLDWFHMIFSECEQHVLSHEHLLHLFSSLLPSLPPQCVNPKGLQLYISLQKSLAERGDGEDSRFQLDASHGATFIWDVALKALDQGVSSHATRYILQHILKYLTSSDNDEQTKQLIRSFLQHCMQNLSESITQVKLAFAQEALLTPDEMDARYNVLFRSLNVLFEHVRSIRFHYAFQLHLRSLEDEAARSSTLENLRRPDMVPHLSSPENELSCLCVDCQRSGVFEKNRALYPDDQSASLSEFTIFLDTKTNRGSVPKAGFLTEDCKSVTLRLNSYYLVAQLRAEAHFAWRQFFPDQSESYTRLHWRRNGPSSRCLVQEMSPLSDYRPMQSLVVRRSGTRPSDSAFGPGPTIRSEEEQRSPGASPKENKAALHPRRPPLPQITVLATAADFDATRDDMEQRRLSQVHNGGQTYLPSSLLTPLADTHNSLLLLSMPDAFEQLRRTLRTLSALARRSAEANESLRGSIFTAWQILLELPTCQRQCDALRQILTGTDRPDWSSLLPIQDPFLLLYNLILIDRQLSRDQLRGPALKSLCVRRGLVEFLSMLAFDQDRGISWLGADQATLDEWGLQAVSYALLLLTKLKAQEARCEPAPSPAAEQQAPLSPTRCVTPPPSRPDEVLSASAAKRRRRSLHEVRSGSAKEGRGLQLRPRSSSEHGEACGGPPSNGLVITIPPNSTAFAAAATTAAVAVNGDPSVGVGSAPANTAGNFSDISSSSSSSGTSHSGTFRLFNIPAIECRGEGGCMGSPTIVVRRLMRIIEDAVTKESIHGHKVLTVTKQAIRNAFRLLVPMLLCSDEAAATFLDDKNELKRWLEQILCVYRRVSVELLIAECTGWLRILCYGHVTSRLAAEAAELRPHVRFARPLLHCLIPFLRPAMAVRGLYILRAVEEHEDPNRLVFHHYCSLVSSMLDVLAAHQLPGDDPLCRAWPLDLSEFAQEVSELLSNPPGPAGDTENTPSSSLAFYLDPLGSLASRDILGVMMLLKSIVRRTAEGADSVWATHLVESVFGLLFELPTFATKELPLLRKKEEREEAYGLLEALAGISKSAFSLLGSRLQALHSSLSNLRPGEIIWDKWPETAFRLQNCSTVGLTNLGATCYLNATMQQIFMDQDLRKAILSAQFVEKEGTVKRETFHHLQHMFAFLADSVGGEFNSKQFCESYTMNETPLNPCEQRDMNEFFIDLIDKLEHVSPELTQVFQSSFRGQMCTNVTSLDCEHGRRLVEYFYTVPLELNDVTSLPDSLKKWSDKDILEGDNMWICEKCGKKMKAEKRMAMCRLPRILCFNSMRYHYDPTSCQRVKVNSFFQFPIALNMGAYMEHTLFPDRPQSGEGQSGSSSMDVEEDASLDYELIGVTLHLGTAEVGHYYVILRDSCSDQWYRISDAIIKPFDPNQIPGECFGGSVTEDATRHGVQLATEQSNNAYMLFYERKDKKMDPKKKKMLALQKAAAEIEIPQHLKALIVQNNRVMMYERFVFNLDYYAFVHRMCADLPPLPPLQDQNGGTAPSVVSTAMDVLISFVFNIYIYGKKREMQEPLKATLAALFKASPEICSSFLNFLSQPGELGQPWGPWLEALCSAPSRDIRMLIASIIASAATGVAENDRPSATSLVAFANVLMTLLEARSSTLPRSELDHLHEAFELMRELSSKTQTVTSELLRLEGFKRIAATVAQVCDEETGEESAKPEPSSHAAC